MSEDCEKERGPVAVLQVKVERKHRLFHGSFPDLPEVGYICGTIAGKVDGLARVLAIKALVRDLPALLAELRKQQDGAEDEAEECEE